MRARSVSATSVFVTVKAWQVAPLAPSLAPLVGPSTMVIPVQNGVEAADQLAAALGEAPVVGGLCLVIATRQAPGHMKIVGPFELTLGERSGEREQAARRAGGGCCAPQA